MTSAPKSDSTVAAAGAAIKLAQSSTFSPSKMPFSSIVASLPLRFLLADKIPLQPGFGRHLNHVGRVMQRPAESWADAPAVHQPVIPVREQCGVAAGGGGIDGNWLVGWRACRKMVPRDDRA